MNLDSSTITAIIAIVVVITLFKFILRLPFYILGFAVFAALAVAAYRYFGM